MSNYSTRWKNYYKHCDGVKYFFVLFWTLKFPKSIAFKGMVLIFPLNAHTGFDLMCTYTFQWRSFVYPFNSLQYKKICLIFLFIPFQRFFFFKIFFLLIYNKKNILQFIHYYFILYLAFFPIFWQKWNFYWHISSVNCPFG